ncbi:MAG: WD40/YVTN/BNR-like repeat-containing protein [Actinomycetota bacterium]
MNVLAGTSDGLYALGGSGATGGMAEAQHHGHRVASLAAGGSEVWALLDDRSVLRRDARGAWVALAATTSDPLTCVNHTPAGWLAGTAGAHLLQADSMTAVSSFDAVEGRERWFTPWGGPPDTRSISASEEVIYVNVHVGGIPCSTDRGRTWHPTIDVDADVHQALAHDGLVLGAAAVGLAVSGDQGRSWTVREEGLHSTYLRAVAVAGDTVLVSASRGPGGRQSSIYRGALTGGTLERCRDGLPEWFSSNIDTGCLAAHEELAVFGTAEGSVFVSEDAGRRWELFAEGLPPVLCLVLA